MTAFYFTSLSHKASKPHNIINPCLKRRLVLVNELTCSTQFGPRLGHTTQACGDQKISQQNPLVPTNVACSSDEFVVKTSLRFVHFFLQKRHTGCVVSKL